MKAKETGKSLSQLKEDREKAIKDLQTLQEQLIGVRYVIVYLNQEIKKLDGGV